MALLLICALVTATFSALFIVFPWFDVIWWCSLVLACCWSVILATRSKFSDSARIFPQIDPNKKLYYPLPEFKSRKRCTETKPVPAVLHPIVSELSDLILRDFVQSWYCKLVSYKTSSFLTQAKSDIDYVSGSICQLLSSVAYLEFIAGDFPQALNDHIHQVQQASNADGQLAQPFILHECARDKAKEEAHLTTLSRILCYKLLPPHHDRLSMDLAVAIFTKQVLLPLVDYMTDPANVNKSLLSYLTYQEQLVSGYKRTFKYAASYESFVELIGKCNDIGQLKQIRYHIITEIMHSTTLKGLKTENESAHSSHNKNSQYKADMLRSRDLKRYANQLRVAKTKCEKRIMKLGGEEYAEYFSDEQSSNQVRGHKVISFKLTMHSLACRGAFHSFLKADDSESLLEYWVAVETLKSCDVGERHRLAAEIYNKYIVSRVSLVRLDRTMLKEMESFLIGNRGPEAFYDAQEIVYRQLEKNHYPQFLVSDVYHNFIVSWDGSESVSEETTSFGSNEDYEEDDDYQEVDDDDDEMQQTASEYNKKKVADIDDKIYNKTKAFQALNSEMFDAASHSKFTPVLTELQREIDALKLERRALEAHQQQVESWWKHVGLWNATVVQHELVKEDEGWIVYYVIMIRLQDQLTASATDRNGWVVTRTLRQIKDLHQDICQIDEDVSQLSLPSKIRIGKPSDEYIKKSIEQITSFLQWVIADKTLSQSSELFNFVSSHPHLNTDHAKKSAIFKVPKLFKRRPTGDSDQDSADLLFFNMADNGPKESRRKDSIARPLYSLASEVFELSSKFLRKTVVQLVQVTYGKSINRQIRETVDWMVSEPMLVYYLKFFRDLFWVDGELAPPAPTQTDEEMQKTKAKARSALVKNTPELIIRIFGEKTAKKGFIKLFDTFQDQSLNKHFFYVLLSMFTDRLFPQLVDAKRSRYQQRELSEFAISTSTIPIVKYTSVASASVPPELLSTVPSNNEPNTMEPRLPILDSQRSIVSDSGSETSQLSAHQDCGPMRSSPSTSSSQHLYKRYVAKR